MKVRIQRLLAGFLIGGMLTCPALAAPFPDVDEDAEYADAVEYLSEVGIMCGDDKGNFNPDKTVTRAEMATIICNMMDEVDDAANTEGAFTDVPKSHWASEYISKAVSLGIISGYGDGRFGPDDTVTYEQALTMIVSFVGLSDAAIKYGGYPDGYIFVADDYGYTKQLSAKKGDLLKRWQVAHILYYSMA